MASKDYGKNPVKVQIGHRIREARDARDMSQHDLALVLGVTAGAVGQWELGITIPKTVTMSRLPSILGVSREWLEGEDGKSSMGMQAHSKDEEMVLGLFRKLTSDEQGMVIRQLSGLVRSK
jgi:transcriptional regulator with XRE-family HTH domain